MTRSSAARSTLKMLRVVLCIICLHPFLWLFLFALLYHTVKDFFVLILLKIDQFCMVLVFLDVLQDFNPLAVAGSQSAFAFAPLRFAACSTSWAGLAPALLANRAAPVGLLSWIALGSFAWFWFFWTFYRFRGGAGRKKSCDGAQLFTVYHIGRWWCRW